MADKPKTKFILIGVVVLVLIVLAVVFMNFNEFKGQKPKNAPDVKFVFTVESD